MCELLEQEINSLQTKTLVFPLLTAEIEDVHLHEDHPSTLEIMHILHKYANRVK